MPEKKQEYWIPESIKEVSFEEKYEILTELGKGATSVVHKCNDKGTSKAWAVKIINKRVDFKVINTEIGVLLKLNHPNVDSDKGFYSEKDAAAAVKQMLIAVQYLHQNGVVHRDLKPENLLYEDLREDSALKVAPEVLAGKKYTPAVDVWSCGVITYILLCGYEPFYEESEREVYKRILKGDYHFDSPFWDSISWNAKDLISKMLQLDPKKRITADQALQHPWVKGSAAKNEHMAEAQNKIKEFNAARKMRATMDATLLAARVGRVQELLSSISDVSQQSVPMEM
ncbi:CAMK4 [Mytilus edulis]|uniref:CAMK4 n=1 Tax=Mytilus edulis TaxID=6550 RepID=A0A8S3TW83_MYTED|nr:CAMK4 [Mytilus edulis]